VISHKLIATHHEVSLHAKALEQTRDLWKQEFGSEYLYDLDAALPQVPPYFVDDFLSASVERRGTRQTFQSQRIEKLDGSEGSSWVNPMSYVSIDPLIDVTNKIEISRRDLIGLTDD